MVLTFKYALRIGGIGCCFLATIAPALRAAEPPLAWQQLKGEAALDKKVSLEAKRQNLPEVLAAVGRQTGTTLSVAPEGGLDKKLVTARIDAMNLYDFMGALARTYVAEWHRTNAGGYALSLQNLDDAAAKKAQVGTPLFFQYRTRVQPFTGEITQRRGRIYQQVLDEVNRGDLESKQGVSVSELDPETLAALRAEYEAAHADSILPTYALYEKAMLRGSVIRIIKKTTASEQATGLNEMNGKPIQGENNPFFAGSTTVELLDENGESSNTNPAYPLKWTVERARRAQEKEETKPRTPQ